MRGSPLVARLAAILLLALSGTTAVAAPTGAHGGELGGAGNEYFLHDAWSAAADHHFFYGRPADRLYVGDWNGDRKDTLAVRRGNIYYVRNALSGGPADATAAYGRSTDTVLVGDWDGDGDDTLAVRRGNLYYFKNSLSSGVADRVQAFGRVDDVVLVGDWDGDGDDTLAVRRGNLYYYKNDFSPGEADFWQGWGRPTDAVLTGDWEGDGIDTLAVRRGNQYYTTPDFFSGPGVPRGTYGRVTDTAFAGDWNGDGRDTLGFRRAPIAVGSGTYRVGSEVPPGTYRSFSAEDCYWERLSDYPGEAEEDILGLGWGPRQIVTIEQTDVGFHSDPECGTWTEISVTYPHAPATTFADGVHVVGRDIAPGTYVASDPELCYWERLSGFTGTSDDVIADNDVEGEATVTISSSDLGFFAVECGTWTAA